MCLIACFDRQLRPLPEGHTPSLLPSLAVEWGEMGPRQRPVSSAPHLTYARELHGLEGRFQTVLMDRARFSPAATGANHRKAVARGPAACEPLELHTHRDREIRVVLAGQASFTLEAPFGWATVLCGGGDWIALPPGLPHRCEPSPAQGVDLLRLFSMPDGWAPTPAGRDVPRGLGPWPEVPATRMARAVTA
jgi:hypothetical protein